MRNARGRMGIGALVALVSVGALVACRGDAGETQEVAIARSAPPATAVDRVVAVDTAPVLAPPPVVQRTVTYGEAESEYRSGRFVEAADLFSAYVAGRPQDAHGHYMLGLSSWRAGDLESAGEALTRAVELDGTNVRVRTNLARVLLAQRRPEEAVPHLEEALVSDPGSHEAWRVLGNARSQLGQVADAIDAYQEALALNSDDAWTMNNYGLLLIQQSRFEEAVPPLARAVEIMPGSALFQNNLGVALERIGELELAAQAYEAAITADESHDRARASLARVRARLEAIQPQAMQPGDTVELHSFASEFSEQVERWRYGIDDDYDDDVACLH